MATYREFLAKGIEDGKLSFYHFSDRANLDSILKHGILSSEQRDKEDIKPMRQGGNDESMRQDKIKGLTDFVSLAFCDKHKMFHTAAKQNRVKEPIFIYLDSKKIISLECKISLCVANSRKAVHFDLDEDIKSDFDCDCLLSLHNNRSIAREGSRLDNVRKYELLVKKRICADNIVEVWACDFYRELLHREKVYKRP